MLFNPFTGTPRHPDDIKSDPDGFLLWDGEARLRAAQAAQPAQDGCLWTPEDDDNMPGTYASACGELWTFTEGGPVENGCKFCHGCGGSVLIAAPAHKEQGNE